MENTFPRTIDSNYCKPIPFLRWAGGKSWLLKHLATLLPNFDFNSYHEPFLGGGATFFHLNPTNKSFLSDLNFDLIHTYLTIQENVERVIVELKKFKNTKSFYYEIRNKNFKNDYKKAACFIYLNQTSFNGIYRVNLDGNYNVPYGFRTKNFIQPTNLRLASLALQNAKIQHHDFDIIRANIKKGDFVFLDPPYTVTHNNNGFIKYNQKIFSLDDQYRLSNLIDFICAKGCYYVLTNAAHSEIEKIFEKGHNKFHLQRKSLIAANNEKRGQYAEVIFTNIRISKN